MSVYNVQKRKQQANTTFFHLPYFANCQGWLSNGHAFLVCSHLLIQCKWNAWLQVPHAATHSLSVSVIAVGWHWMHGSMMWFLQMAQFSTAMSHDQKATAVHFFTSNFFFGFGATCSSAATSSMDSSTSILSSAIISLLFFTVAFPVYLIE